MRTIALIIASIFACAGIQAKTLIVYYSYTNNIGRVVSELRTQIDADVVRIEPAEKGLDYAANNYAIGSSQISAIRNNPGDASSYPAIDPVEINLERYSTVIVAAPLWWSNMAAPMQSFLFSYGRMMAGKNIGLIVSSASSGISGVEADAHRLIPEGNFLTPSLWIRSSQTSDARPMVADWLEAIDYTSLNTSDMSKNQITIKVGEVATLTATLVENSSADALLKLLEPGPVIVNMHDYANMEKVGSLPEMLPRNDTYFTAEPGDLVLYLGNQFVMYYGDNTYNFTRLGKINGNYTGQQLKSILGDGDVTVTLAAGGPSGIEDVAADVDKRSGGVYDLSGNMVLGSSSDISSLAQGIYIIDGRKTLVCGR